MSASADDSTFLRDFFQALSDRPLEPADDVYVPIYEDRQIAGEDPVDLLARGIEWTQGEGVQLLAGLRGTGKSTELRRLRRRLAKAGNLVVLCDLEDYLDLSIPIDVGEVLMVLAGAFSDGMRALGVDVGRESYWEQLIDFLLIQHKRAG